MQWGPYIFLRFAASLLAGILWYVHGGLQIPVAGEAFAITAIIYGCLRFFTPPTFKKNFHPLLGFLAFLQLFLFGYWFTEFRTARNDAQHFLYAGEIEHYVGTIISEVEKKARSFKATVNVEKVYSDSLGWRKVNGQLLVYFAGTDSTFSMKYGDHLLIHGKPSELSPPGNPEEFDYRRYLSFHQVYHQHFLREGDYKLLGNQPPSTIMEAAYAMRSYGRSLFRQFVRGEQEYAIAIALIFGIRDGLDNDIKNAYSSAGAMHVLAVSGLHVGILYQVMYMLLGFLKRKKQSRHLFFLTILFTLWAYAFLTGLSASVLRAVTMFSVITVAQWIGRAGNIYNTLAVSAFVLMLLDPYVVMQVGFMLSYAAVIGIVLLQPRLYRLWLAPNRFLDWVWGITCVSVAAQIATFPIGLLFFHQFPTYFFISNLFVIPGAFLIVYFGLSLVAIGSFSGWIAALLGEIMHWLIWGMNKTVFWVEQLPGSLITGFHINVPETWCWYVLIAGFTLLMVKRKFKYVLWMLVAGSLLGCYQTAESWEQSQQQWVSVYNIRGNANIAFTSGMKTLFTGDDALLEDTERLRFHVWQSLWSRGSKENHFIGFNSLFTKNSSEGIAVINGLSAAPLEAGKLFTWNGKTFLLLSEKVKAVPEMEVDFLIISHNALKSLKAASKLKANLIIADASNTRFYLNRWQTEAEELGISFYRIDQNGAFVLSLK